MTYHGHIENGQVVFDAAPGLPEGTPVVVTVVLASVEPKAREIQTLYRRSTSV